MSEENDYSLRASFEKVGLLPGARLLIDKEGKIIDGVHSWLAAKQLGLEIPTVVVDIANDGEAALIKLVTNKCRRELEPEEITQCLDVIGRTFNWKANDFVEKLPFSYSWLMKYLPDQYKDAVKAKAGAEGGKATAKAFREATATQRAPKSQDTRHEEPLTEVSAAEEKDLKKPKAEAEIPPVQEPHERFNRMFSSHLSQFKSHTRTMEKQGLPEMRDYVDEKHDCTKCNVKSSCEKFFQFYKELMDWHNRIPTLLPDCMKNKINNSPL